MFMTLARIRYAMTAVALIVISIIIAVIYTRPTDIYGLDSGLVVDTIDISLVYDENDVVGENNMVIRSAQFHRGEEGFDEALSKVEALEFKRPFKNLLPQFGFLKGSTDITLTGDYDYHIVLDLYAEGSERADLTFLWWANSLEYRKDTYDTSFPLKATANTESSRSFGDFFWEQAVESEN